MESMFGGLSGEEKPCGFRESATDTGAVDLSQEAFKNRGNSGVFASQEKRRNYAGADHSCQHFQAGKKISESAALSSSNCAFFPLQQHIDNSPLEKQY